jgi:hypothetical protein
LVAAGLLFAGGALPTAGQGLRTVIESRGKAFPGVGAGVTAMKRDSAGRYFILAKPETVISVYDRDGNPIGQIPNAKSNGATIRYAADIDLNPDGQLVVADRGANAILVFAADGSLISRTPVNAPTSVVALSGGQFAVASLTSQRLVQVLDQRGKVVRSFGDSTEVDEQAEKEALKNLGRISGDATGGIYYAFTSLPDPTVRKYDRFGYVAYETSVPEHMFGEGPTEANDRVEFTFGYSEMSFSDQTTTWMTLGSSDDLKFGGGVGRGFDEAMRRGMGLGQAVQQQSMMQNGPGGSPFGAVFSGLLSDQETKFQFGMGSMSGTGGRGRGRGGFGSASSDQSMGQSAALWFGSSGSDSGTIGDGSAYGQSSFDASSMAGELQSEFYGANDFGSSDSSGTYAGAFGGANQGALPGAFVFGTMFNSFHFRPPGGREDSGEDWVRRKPENLEQALGITVERKRMARRIFRTMEPEADTARIPAFSRDGCA